jgi:hypothetical protein
MIIMPQAKALTNNHLTRDYRMGKIDNGNEKNFPPTFEGTVALVADWSKNGGIVRLGGHLKYDRAYRHITRRDCLYFLETGHLSWPPEWDDWHENWVFHVGGWSLDDDLLELLFTIDYNHGIIEFLTAKSWSENG